MVKVLAGVLAVVAIALAIRWLAAPPPLLTHLSPCENDCINDSGGPKWCAEFCKTHASYGPPHK